jgi:hypothetical protein
LITSSCFAPECHDLAPDTAFPGQFLKWALNQSHFTRQGVRIKDALDELDIPRDRYDELAEIIQDPSFRAWARDHIGFHCFQNNGGFTVKVSTLLATASEYLWYRDNTKPKERGLQ